MKSFDYQVRKRLARLGDLTKGQERTLGELVALYNAEIERYQKLLLKMFQIARSILDAFKK